MVKDCIGAIAMGLCVEILDLFVCVLACRCGDQWIHYTNWSLYKVMATIQLALNFPLDIQTRTMCHLACLPVLLYVRKCTSRVASICT